LADTFERERDWSRASASRIVLIFDVGQAPEGSITSPSSWRDESLASLVERARSSRARRVISPNNVPGPRERPRRGIVHRDIKPANVLMSAEAT